MSEAKGDLILLLSRENGLFWFSLDNEQSLSPIFLKASDPGGPLYMFHRGRLLPEIQPGDQASPNELFDNLRFILKHNIYHKADFLFYERTDMNNSVSVSIS